MPTYNERENLEAILDAISAAQPNFHVLVIDDASPDGTGEIADTRAAADERVHVLHRRGKEGLGKAYLDGFAWALASDAGYTHVFEMDADFSHDPRYLDPLLRACTEGGADLAIGSRYVPGGGTSGWPWHRELLSRGGGLYARTLLGLPIRDPTAGFLCFRREALEGLDLRAIETRGYGFQIELKHRVVRAGLRVLEVPIVFAERERGSSKMTGKIAVEAVFKVARLRLRG
nr:polyprenol monophosphomannose synthase [Pseudenhygromyxa sp. WMMC2535]